MSSVQAKPEGAGVVQLTRGRPLLVEAAEGCSPLGGLAAGDYSVACGFWMLVLEGVWGHTVEGRDVRCLIIHE